MARAESGTALTRRAQERLGLGARHLPLAVALARRRALLETVDDGPALPLVQTWRDRSPDRDTVWASATASSLPRAAPAAVAPAVTRSARSDRRPPVAPVAPARAAQPTVMATVAAGHRSTDPGGGLRPEPGVAVADSPLPPALGPSRLGSARSDPATRSPIAAAVSGANPGRRARRPPVVAPVPPAPRRTLASLDARLPLAVAPPAVSAAMETAAVPAAGRPGPLPSSPLAAPVSEAANGGPAIQRRGGRMVVQRDPGDEVSVSTDEVVERVLRRLGRELAVEAERRGINPWLSPS